MFSIPTAELLGINKWVLTIVAGLLMTITAKNRNESAGDCKYDFRTADCDPGGIFHGNSGNETAVAWRQYLISLQDQLLYFTGVGYVIGSFISGGTATPNFIRFAKNNKVAVWTTVIAFFLGNTPDVLFRSYRRRVYRKR